MVAFVTFGKGRDFIVRLTQEEMLLCFETHDIYMGVHHISEDDE